MPFSVVALLDGGRAATRLYDFGEPTFREGLEVVVEAIEREATERGRSGAARGADQRLPRTGEP